MKTNNLKGISTVLSDSEMKQVGGGVKPVMFAEEPNDGGGGVVSGPCGWRIDVCSGICDERLISVQIGNEWKLNWVTGICVNIPKIPGWCVCDYPT